MTLDYKDIFNRLDRGDSHSAIAREVGCTRQAIDRLAREYSLARAIRGALALFEANAGLPGFQFPEDAARALTELEAYMNRVLGRGGE